MDRIDKLVQALRHECQALGPTMIACVKERFGDDPFLVLIACLLSLRTKDSVTLPVCLRLFTHLRTPHDFAAADPHSLQKLIYPVGFYRKKAVVLINVSRVLIERFNGVVPSTRAELLSLPGVGHKTASLVLAEGFGIPAICVDTHVHRISNHLGLVKTKTPAETEKALMAVLPQKYWIEWNRLLVLWGQHIYKSRSRRCSLCPLHFQ